MDHASKIDLALGKQNVDLLLEEAMCGSISQQQMKDIAILLHRRVHGNFRRRREEGRSCDFTELRRILDDWFIFELFQLSQDEGLHKLLGILKSDKVGLAYIAAQMKILID